MRVLVIGGAGYIGSHVTSMLLDAGHTTTVYDNFSSGVEENIFPTAGLVRGDILDESVLNDTMAEGWDAVVHLAALKAAGESMIQPEKYAVNNITGTINVLNAMARAGVYSIVFSSSAAVYGEPEYLPLDEHHPTNPENFYGFTKLEIERLMRWYESLRGIRYASLRYFNAAGYDPHGRVTGLERNPANLLPVILEVVVGRREELQIFGDDYSTPDGTCVRDYVHVTDLADAHVKSLEYIGARGQSLVANLGSGRGYSVTEMVNTVRDITGHAVPTKLVGRRPGDPARLVASSDYARELLGWTPRYSNPAELARSTWQAYLKAEAPTR